MSGRGTDIDFNQIVPRLGSKADAFEELCCQLARRVAGSSLQRLYGAGGDGGIECYFDEAEGRVGWQAKYVFNVDSLITQADRSLDTALQIHPRLTRFILCFPMRMTGPTARRGLSRIEKIDAWITAREKAACRTGKQLTIQLWGDSEIRSLLIEHDSSGGMRHFFFGTTVLSGDWFAGHLQRAIATAGPRYTPDANVETELGEWVAAFGREASWAESISSHINSLRSAEKSLAYTLRPPRDERGGDPVWPDDTLEETRALVERMQGPLDTLDQPYVMTRVDCENVTLELSNLVSELRKVDDTLVRYLEDIHGPGRADSPGWRQFMAELMVAFPTAHLDGIRDLAHAIESLVNWLCSPNSALAMEHLFVLTGDPGTGKTHGVCDAAQRRHDANLRTCIVFGHEFRNQPDPWSRIAESLGISTTLGVDGLLDCMNAAGEASTLPLLLFVDAINETKPPSYWRNYIASMAERISTRPYLRLCLVCKTTYLNHCLPEQHGYPVVTHLGFIGIEREACQAYFSHYGLLPPIAPILQPELANPLFLRLVCETLNNAGQNRLPPGWSGGGAKIIKEFLAQKAYQFSIEFETTPHGASTTCLMKIVREIAALGSGTVPWSTARALILSVVADPDAALTWLVREGLLIQDVSDQAGWEQDPLLRPAFERLGDFLVASEILGHITAENLLTACQPSGLLYPLLKDTAAIRSNQSILGEFSVLAAEKIPGFELSNLRCESATPDDLALIAIRSLVYRNPDSLTRTTARLLRYAFASPQLAYDATDAVLGCAWRASSIDAFWFHDYFAQLSMHERDAYWCRYLHERFEPGTVVKNLIAAVNELPVHDIPPEIAKRWAVILLWFTAASDRRVKDAATRAAAAVLVSATSVIPDIITRFIDINDDEIRERALLSCYGAMLTSRDETVVSSVATYLHETYVKAPSDFNNAVIRDHMRSICELSIELSPVASNDIQPETFTTLPASSNWPLQLPSDEDVETWAESLNFRPDESLSDFFKYSMECLGRWTHGLSKFEMGKWIAQRVALDFAFVGSRCEGYDSIMLRKYGGGRAKPVWAERISKKYQWIAMYQLASRVHDHVEAKLDPWEKNGAKTRLILPQGRMLDPTVPLTGTKPATAEYVWSVPRPKDLDETVLDFQTWVNDHTVPTMKYFSYPTSCKNSRLRPIFAFARWVGVERDADSPNDYRQTWASLQSYLVPRKRLKSVYNALRGQNLLGQSLPRPIPSFRGFAAEYPWGTLFDVKNDDEAYSYGFSENLPTPLIPAWSEIVCEWEYDNSRENTTIHVPSRRLFDCNLQWNGRGGFESPSGNELFHDSSYQVGDPPSLLVDTNFLNQRLKDDNLGMILTLHGEKLVISSNTKTASVPPRSAFCQVAYLDGTKQRSSKLAHFQD